MPAILRKLPFYDRFSTVEVYGQASRVFPYQILVWVSLGTGGARRLDPRTPRFPAVFDAAVTDNFLIHQQQLRDFAGLEPGHRYGWPARWATTARLPARLPGARKTFPGHSSATPPGGRPACLRCSGGLHPSTCGPKCPAAIWPRKWTVG